jgi:hypothetical protein
MADTHTHAINMCLLCAVFLLGVFCTRCLLLLRTLSTCRKRAARPFHDPDSSLLRTRTSMYLIFLGSGAKKYSPTTISIISPPPPFNEIVKTHADTNTLSMIAVLFPPGGHTREMLSLISLWQSVSPQGAAFDFCIGDSDAQSSKLLASFAREHSSLDIKLPPSKMKRNREVGGSFLTAVVNTFGSLLSTIKLIHALRPDLVCREKHLFFPSLSFIVLLHPSSFIFRTASMSISVM